MVHSYISEYFRDKKESFINCKNSNILSNISEKFDIKHITYFCINNHSKEPDDNQLISTYPDRWKDRYLSSNYGDVDPVVRHGVNGFLPLDWSLIPITDKLERDFFGEAREYGISEHGLTVPVRGNNGETALLSINSDLSPRDWADYKTFHVSDIIYFAHLFHSYVLIENQCLPEKDGVHLSRRERQVLIWASLGKTCWETAKILNLKERTVDFYIRNAAVKLKAVSKTQAVTNAIAGKHMFLTVSEN